MSWNIDIKTDKDVTEADIDAIVAQLPKEMLGPFGSKQEWGWSLAVDVHKPEDRKGSFSTPRSIWCGGSCSISGRIAQPFCKKFAKMIRKKLGCKASCSEMSI